MKKNAYVLALSLSVAALFLLSACDFKMVGEQGVVDFHPDDCGPYTLGCNFDKPVVVGGALEVRLDGNFGSSELSLRPEDSTIFSVKSSETGNPTRFTVEAVGVGGTHLMAVDEFGETVDQIFVETASFDGLRLRPFTNLPSEPESDVDGVQTFRVPQAKVVSFFVGPDVGDEWQGMGKLTFQLLSASEELKAAMDAEESNSVEDGFLVFRMPEGTHNLIVATADGALELELVLIAE